MDIFDEQSGTIQSLMKEFAHLYFLRGYNQMDSMGLHPGQVPLLKALYEKEGMSQRELADMLHIKPPTVAVSIKRMEKNGFIERRQDEKDQRITRIYLTEHGKKVNGEIIELLKENEEIIFQGFEEAERYLFKRFFRQMIKNLQMVIPKDVKNPNMHFHGMCTEEQK